MKRPFTQTSGTQAEATDVSNGTPPTSGVSVRTAIFLYAAKVGIIPLKNKSALRISPKITRFKGDLRSKSAYSSFLRGLF